MNQIIEPKTERLRLRQWVSSDHEPFAAMCADPEVMKYFPSTLSRSKSYAAIEFCQSLITQRGWGVWAVELLKTKEFIGIAGLHIPPAELPCSPCVEILWRLARPYWGHGYATEAALSVLKVGFEQLSLEEILAFSSVRNHRSRAVMERINMIDTGETFQHSGMPESSPLRENCIYTISRERWG